MADGGNWVGKVREFGGKRLEKLRRISKSSGVNRAMFTAKVKW